MSRFLDGPAGGREFELQRAPHFIRVVRATSGKFSEAKVTWDVLDLLEDSPRDNEHVFVYQQVPGTLSGPIFACARGGSAGRSGRFVTADYRHRPDVDGEQLRDTDAWRAWADAQPLPDEASR